MTKWTKRTTPAGALIHSCEMTPEEMAAARQYTLAYPPEFPESCKREPEPGREALRRLVAAAKAYRAASAQHQTEPDPFIAQTTYDRASYALLKAANDPALEGVEL